VRTGRAWAEGTKVAAFEMGSPGLGVRLPLDGLRALAASVGSCSTGRRTFAYDQEPMMPIGIPIALLFIAPALIFLPALLG
jgi:hypothetical protein